MQSDPPDEPTRAVARPNQPLTSRERWAAVGLAAACVVGAGAVAAVIGAITGTGTRDVAWSALVYGGLLASAAVVLYVDRIYARQCPRCGGRVERGVEICHACGYDVVSRPRFVCSEGHDVYLDPGMCPCGRRLQPTSPPRGVHGQVIATLVLGAGILVFLVAVWGLLALFG